MKRTIALYCALIIAAGCTMLFAGPKSVPKKFIDSAKTGDIEAMNKLFSRKAFEMTGAETIDSNNRSFSEMVRRAHETRKYEMQDLDDLREGNTAFVSFLYRAADGSDSMGMGFYLSQEDGTWKIDHIGGRDRQDLTQLMRASPSPSEASSPLESSDEPPPPPPPLRTPPRALISGGVLNGKATSLPKPPYPAIAKAAHASGQVNVQVLVDENGNVVSANAISGHPLLRAAAVAAAHQAKFSPTKLSGQPVKVTGIITYNFTAE